MDTPEARALASRVAGLSHDQMRFGLFLLANLEPAVATDILDAAEVAPTGDQPCNC